MKHLYYMYRGATVFAIPFIVTAVVAGPDYLANHFHNPHWYWLYSAHVLVVMYVVGRMCDH